MFVETDTIKGEVDDATFFSIVKDRNPQLYFDMNEKLNEEARMQDTEESMTTVKYPDQPAAAGSFLDAKEGVQ